MFGRGEIGQVRVLPSKIPAHSLVSGKWALLRLVHRKRTVQYGLQEDMSGEHCVSLYNYMQKPFNAVY